MKYTLIFIISFIMGYLFGAFVSLEPNIIIWQEESRFVLMLLTIAITVGVALYDYLNHTQN